MRYDTFWFFSPHLFTVKVGRTTNNNNNEIARGLIFIEDFPLFCNRTYIIYRKKREKERESLFRASANKENKERNQKHEKSNIKTSQISMQTLSKLQIQYHTFLPVELDVSTHSLSL
jgi:hypothetical protein